MNRKTRASLERAGNTTTALAARYRGQEGDLVTVGDRRRAPRILGVDRARHGALVGGQVRVPGDQVLPHVGYRCGVSGTLAVEVTAASQFP
jgi:hypothetical protein